MTEERKDEGAQLRRLQGAAWGALLLLPLLVVALVPRLRDALADWLNEEQEHRLP